MTTDSETVKTSNSVTSVVDLRRRINWDLREKEREPDKKEQENTGLKNQYK